jgi:hypothetical protein
MTLRRNQSNTRKLKQTARKANKSARKAARSAPPKRSIAIVAAAVIGLVGALIAKRFLGNGDDVQGPSVPDIGHAGTAWAPQPVPAESAPESDSG